MYLLSAAEADARARATAARLRNCSVGPGERIALAVAGSDRARFGDAAAELDAATVTIALGALRSGIVPVLVNPALPGPERQRTVDDSDPSLVVDTIPTMMRLASADRDDRSADLPRMPQARSMHYTSGTTGNPKGVWTGMLPGCEVTNWWRDEVEQWPHDPDDVSLVHGPVTHHGPLRFAIMALLGGGDVILPGRFDARAIAESMVRDRPTTAFVVPSHLQRVFALPGGPPPSPYRRLVHAGAACPESLKRAIHAWAGSDKVWEFYGSTEGQFTACCGTEWDQRPGTVGRARSGRTVVVDDGVIWCRGPDYCRFEYFRDPEKTASAWRADSPPAGAAFTVGDLGRLDEDGYLWLDGRREDLIITGGVNVYPAQVESALSGIPGVDQLAVFGVSDDRWGQRVLAAYVGTAEPETVKQWCRSRLANFQTPKVVYRVDGLPMTESGKIRRLALAGIVGLARD